MTLNKTLEVSIATELMKKHFLAIMDQHEVNMHEDAALLNVDIVREYLEAAEFCNKTFGKQYRTIELKIWLDEQD